MNDDLALLSDIAKRAHQLSQRLLTLPDNRRSQSYKQFIDDFDRLLTDFYEVRDRIAGAKPN